MTRPSGEIFGGKSVGSGNLSPRTRRAQLGQVDTGRKGVTVPNLPTNLAVSATAETTATITFTAPSYNGNSDILNYQYSTNGTTYTSFSPIDITSPVVVPGLSGNTAYTIYLRAINDIGFGDPSAGLSVTTRPAAPTGLSVSSTSFTTVNVAFTPPAGAVTITNYEFSTNGSTWTALSPADTTSPVTVTGLTAGTSYTIYLRAVNSAGGGTSSAGLAVTTLKNPVVASGGTVSDITISGVPYKLHTFTGTSTLTVTAAGTVQYMMVGGGASTSSTSTGGGAGQVIDGNVAAAVTTYTITVGGAATASSGIGITANGVSGSTSGNGYAGGSGYSGTFQNSLAGGGGGATAVGGNALSNTQPGAGGAGRDISTWLGQSAGTTYKGGGGGGAGYANIDWGNPYPTTSAGGIGGGGNGGHGSNSANGAPNSGGGAGSGGGTQGIPYDTGTGRTGGSGIVYIRYPRDYGL